MTLGFPIVNHRVHCCKFLMLSNHMSSYIGRYIKLQLCSIKTIKILNHFHCVWMHIIKILQTHNLVIFLINFSYFSIILHCDTSLELSQQDSSNEGHTRCFEQYI